MSQKIFDRLWACGLRARKIRLRSLAPSVSYVGDDARNRILDAVGASELDRGILQHGLYAEIKDLAKALEGVTAQGMAATFGVCGRALAPLLEKVEQRSGGKWRVPDLPLALARIEEFASGSDAPGDHSGIRERLMGEIPDEHPWSTYAQDVLICVDAGLAAASAEGRPKPIVIQYALEPLVAFMQNRDADVIRVYGVNYWSAQIAEDPVMANALKFLQNLIGEVSQAVSVDPATYSRLVSDAGILRPGAQVPRREPRMPPSSQDPLF